MNPTRVIQESQRDSVLKLRVAESARLPLVTRRHSSQPRRGCVHPRATNRRNPVGVEVIFNPVSQGSSCLATPGLRAGIPLGFGGENESETKR